MCVIRLFEFFLLLSSPLVSLSLSLSRDCTSICHTSSHNVDCRFRFSKATDTRLTAVPTDCIPLDATNILLDYHAITELRPNEFSKFVHLKTISLEYNRISKIDDTAFDGLDNLSSLKLHYNELTEFPVVGAKRIVHLELTENRITQVAPQHLTNLTELESLNLNDNLITKIEDFTFVDACKLTNLYLRRNRLETLGTYAMAGAAIELLDIRETDVTNFPTAGLQNLRELRATSTRSLKSFPSPPSLPSIRKLSLTYNSHCCMYADATYGTVPAPLPECNPSPTPTGDETRDLDAEISRRRSDAARAFCRTQAPLCFEKLPEGVFPSCDPNGPAVYHLPGGDVTVPRCSTSAPTTAPNTVPAFLPCDPDGPVVHHLPQGDLTVPQCNESAPTSVLIPIPTGRLVNTMNAPDRLPVVCAPLPDDFNSCDDVMGNWVLRIAVWLVVAVNLVGNTTVVVVFAANSKRFNAVKLLLCNMAFADGLMGVYLVVLAIVDASTYGAYADDAIAWKTGGGCATIGFLSVFASLLSLYTLVAITCERFYTIHYAMYGRKLGVKQAAAVVAVGWAYAFIMALLPLVGVSNYTSTAVCLPFSLENGGRAYLTFALSLNLVAFVTIATIYVYLFCSIAGRGPRARNTDFSVFKKMMILVIVDFMCWMPIIVVGLLSANRSDVAVSLASAKWIVVFIYPLNSCANPFLYAIFTRPFKRDFFEFFHRFGLFEEQFFKHSRPSSFRRSDRTPRPRSASQYEMTSDDNLGRHRQPRLSVSTNISVVYSSSNGQAVEMQESALCSTRSVLESVTETVEKGVMKTGDGIITNGGMKTDGGDDAEPRHNDRSLATPEQQERPNSRSGLLPVTGKVEEEGERREEITDIVVV